MNENEKLKAKSSSLQSKLSENLEHITELQYQNLHLNKERDNYKQLNQTLKDEIKFKVQSFSMMEGAKLTINEQDDDSQKSFEKVNTSWHICFLFCAIIIGN